MIENGKASMASTLQIRIPLHLRKKFSEVANKNNVTPARLIREFIHKYIAENDKDAK